uniref:Putative glycosyltransferase n=1 Tax=viral metagenome TaxID=1070528 RepID=A0A6M3Y4Z7_9ZZZZ
MRVSIVIPSYNQSNFLPSAIESALEQKCEVIVVDDGSTDGSLEIAKGYKGVKVISQVNKGLASARNTGIMNAKGDYCLFLDADDIMLEKCVERILEVAKETDADVIAPSFKCFGVANQELILMPNPTLEDFKTGNRIAYCSAIKRKVLLAVGGYSPRMAKGYEDFHLSFNLLTRGYKFVTIPEVLWLYRVREDSMITESVKHHDELMAQIQKDFKIYE